LEIAALIPQQYDLFTVLFSKQNLFACPRSKLSYYFFPLLGTN